MKRVAGKFLPPDSTARFFASMLRHGPFAFVRGVVSSLYATFKLTGHLFPVQCVVFPGVVVKIVRHSTALATLHGRLIFRPHSNMRGFSSITLDSNSTFSVAGDFQLGQGVSVSVADGGSIEIGGRSTSSGSGITSESIVMIEKSLSIGSDVIIAWGCTVSDSDWHEIEGVERCLPVEIADNVWIGHNVSVLKGAQVPAGCIVGPRSIVGRAEYPENALLAGVPAKVLREGVKWQR